jgi:hypothetical protein
MAPIKVYLFFKLLIKRKYVTLGHDYQYKSYIYEASWRITIKNENNFTAENFLSMLAEYADENNEGYSESSDNEEIAEEIDENEDYNEDSMIID